MTSVLDAVGCIWVEAQGVLWSFSSLSLGILAKTETENG